MATVRELRNTLENHYVEKRMVPLIEKAGSVFSAQQDIRFFSSPGRTEICGNHTDHNGGKVLAGAVDLDIVAAVAKNETPLVRIQSQGYADIVVDSRESEAKPEERNTPSALLRGVMARMKESGYTVGGFDALIHSTVPKGSGLSSSASFEVLLVTILDVLFNNGSIDPLTAAQIGKYAENTYFGKPCGLMDQTACASGSVVKIDFADQQHPALEQLDLDLEKLGYALVIVDTGGDHADLTDEYAAVEGEMKRAAAVLGGRQLADVSREEFLAGIPAIREQVNDRAVMRAFHFFEENIRVEQAVEALKNNDFSGFLALIAASGRSSWMLCQNCYPSQEPTFQNLCVALKLSEELLCGRGASRVHGGGFAGTIQAFVPRDLLDEYVKGMETVFGGGSCVTITIRNRGVEEVEL
jgi:galactokinase